MTKAQARHATLMIAERASDRPVAVHLNGGITLRGHVEYDEETGLLVIDSGRAFVRAEQTAAIEVQES